MGLQLESSMWLVVAQEENERRQGGEMDIHGHPWMSMYAHGYPWTSMDIHGHPWISMDDQIHQPHLLKPHRGFVDIQIHQISRNSIN